MEYEALCAILYSTKKAFYYNFFTTKMEEDALTSSGVTIGGRRILVEIRDVYPPPSVDPWFLKKTLNPKEMAYGTVLLSCNDMFNHVLRHWSMDMVISLTIGLKIGVILLDVTDEQNPKEYSNGKVVLQMQANANDEFVLSCMDLFQDHRLKLGDGVCLGWDPGRNCFRVKVLIS